MSLKIDIDGTTTDLTLEHITRGDLNEFIASNKKIIKALYEQMSIVGKEKETERARKTLDEGLTVKDFEEIGREYELPLVPNISERNRNIKVLQFELFVNEIVQDSDFFKKGYEITFKTECETIIHFRREFPSSDQDDYSSNSLLVRIIKANGDTYEKRNNDDEEIHSFLQEREYGDFIGPNSKLENDVIFCLVKILNQLDGRIDFSEIEDLKVGYITGYEYQNYDHTIGRIEENYNEQTSEPTTIDIFKSYLEKHPDFVETMEGLSMEEYLKVNPQFELFLEFLIYGDNASEEYLFPPTDDCVEKLKPFIDEIVSTMSDNSKIASVDIGEKTLPILPPKEELKLHLINIESSSDSDYLQVVLECSDVKFTLFCCFDSGDPCYGELCFLYIPGQEKYYFTAYDDEILSPDYELTEIMYNHRLRNIFLTCLARLKNINLNKFDRSCFDSNFTYLHKP